MNNTLLPCETCNALIPSELYYSHIYTCRALNNSFFENNVSETVTSVKRTSSEIDNKIPSFPVLEKIECFVCMETIKVKIKELDCGHKMCVNCCNLWFKKSNNCAYCKKKVFD